MSDVNVLAELERIGVHYEWAGDEEVRVKCPFHDDDSPSCGVNVAKRVFNCHTAGCGRRGDFVTLLAQFLKTTRATVWADLSERYALESGKTIEPELVERYHAAVWDAKPLLKELYDRGVTDQLIRKYRLGECRGRVTIPIKNAAGAYVDVMRYLPGAPGPDKMRHTKGFAKLRLWPLEQLVYDRVALCGGPIKAVVAAAHLNRHSVGAVTVTGGEGQWDDAFTPKFAGKQVYVVGDVDPPGRAATELHLKRLNRVARWVGDATPPLDPATYPHGDVNDYVARERGSLKRLVDSAERWQPVIRGGVDDAEEAEDCSLTRAVEAPLAGKRVRVRVVAGAVGQAPYVVPASVVVDCDRSQSECSSCAVFALPPDAVHRVPAESPAVLAMVGEGKRAQREALMEAVGVPPSCRVCLFEPRSHMTVEDARLSSQLEITSRAAERVLQPAMVVGGGLELNESYVMEGRMHPHPKNQLSTLLISKKEFAQDALSSYVPTDLDRLRIFQPTEWTEAAVATKLDDLYADLEANVTRIYKRRAVHLLADLAWHSPLLLDLDGKTVKGWVEVLVMGDQSQGKSETVIGLLNHYGLGEKVECKNASVAGLLGGLQKMSDKWYVTWGVIPTQDKRLVFLEEVKGMEVDVIAKMTDMRSSGIAELEKIEKRRTHARVRWIVASNCRGVGRSLADYNFGVEAVRELIGSPEDVRRFDAALLVSATDVDAKELQELKRHRPVVEHRHTRALCRALVLWAWTRSAQQVQFQPTASSLMTDEATAFCEEFTESDVPLVDRGSMREKLARLSASLACRTFSADEADPMTVVVRPCHVAHACAFLRAAYRSPVMGYREFTEQLRSYDAVRDPAGVRDRVEALPFPAEFVRHILNRHKVEQCDLQDWTGWGREDSQELLSFLVRKNALLRNSRGYVKTPDFIRMLRAMGSSGGLQDRPAHLPEF